MNPGQKNFYAMTEVFNSVPIPDRQGEYTFSASRENWSRVADWLDVLIRVYVPPHTLRDACTALRAKIVERLKGVPTVTSTRRYIIWTNDESTELVEAAIAYICAELNQEAEKRGNTALKP